MSDTKTLILQKTFSLFLEKGYAATSISDIQQAAGIGRATVYHHFKNKETLLMEVIQGYFIHLSEMLNAEITDQKLAACIEERLEKLCVAFNKIFNEEKKISMINYLSLMHTAADRLEGLVAEFRRQMDKEKSVWIKAIENSIKAGEVRKDIAVPQTAELFVAVQDSTFLTSGFFGDFDGMLAKTRELYYHIFDLIRC